MAGLACVVVGEQANTCAAAVGPAELAGSAELREGFAVGAAGEATEAVQCPPGARPQRLRRDFRAAKDRLIAGDLDHEGALFTAHRDRRVVAVAKAEAGDLAVGHAEGIEFDGHDIASGAHDALRERVSGLLEVVVAQRFPCMQAQPAGTFGERPFFGARPVFLSHCMPSRGPEKPSSLCGTSSGPSCTGLRAFRTIVPRPSGSTLPITGHPSFHVTGMRPAGRPSREPSPWCVKRNRSPEGAWTGPRWLGSGNSRARG